MNNASGNKITGLSFAQFLRHLTAGFGQEATAVRHELYFTLMVPAGVRPPWLQAIRALAALVRDAVRLWLVAGRPGDFADQDLLLVVTLSGASGWQTLQRSLAALPADRPAAIVLHPRLAKGGTLAGQTVIRLPVVRLPRPPLSALRDAWRLARSALDLSRRTADRPAIPLSPLAVAATLARHHLWRAAWQQIPRDRPKALLLHNDFDMMSGAALDHGMTTICCQHGVPTDEFFPARADYHVVWGRSSADAYQRAGVAAPQLVIDALGRGDGGAVAPVPPAGVALISQGHTVAYGPGLGARLVALAAELSRLLPIPLRVLLHPAESFNHSPYHRLDRVIVSRPPHDVLRHQPGAPPWLVIGFSSTALLDAAVAGHYVVGLDWPMPGGIAARMVSTPPVQFAVAQDMADCYNSLMQNEQARQRMAADMSAWRQLSFAGETGALARLLAACFPS